jgi:DNA-binding NtrC family response regulator
MKPSLVLLIDDDALVAKSLDMILKTAGFAVLVATSVAAAIEAWETRQDEIDLVITDWGLSAQTNGEQLINRFRKDRPDLKSILCSAYPLHLLFTNRTEGVDFFQKPVLGRDLIAAVRQALGS